MKNLKKLISQEESEKLEFKKSVADWKAITKTATAFSNTTGGKIIIGISNSGKLFGVKIGKGTIENITNQISQNTDPKIHPHISVEKINKKNVIIIEVKESTDHLTLAFGRPFKRVGKSTIKMSKDEYENLILEKHKEKLYFDSQICKRAKLKDINKESVRWFIQEAKRKRGLDIDENLSTEEILEKLNLIKDKKITNAAILLFGKKPQEMFLQTVIKAIRFKGTGVTKDMLDFKTIEEYILSQIKKAEDFIIEHIPKRVRIEDGKLQRQEKWLYPPRAIREALVNALAHRDYKTTAGVQIRIFDDRLEIWNPGRLASNLTIQKLKTKHDSIPGNPLIARAFFWVKYVEEVGTGTNKIIKWCKEWELPEPEFEETGTSYVNETLLEALNERQKKAINYLREKGKITNSEYQKLCEGINRETIRKDLNELIDKKIIVRKGKKRGVYYELI
jgi:ATP-dependent DNA helicase RecG